LFGDLVTTVAWQVSESTARALLEAARKENPEFNKWILLIHDVGRLENEANLVRNLIIEFAPNYVLADHSHTLPYTSDSWFSDLAQDRHFSRRTN
jgi:hypothetical protein